MGLRKSDIADHRMHPAAQIGNCFGNLIQRPLATRIDDDRSTFCGEEQRGRPPIPDDAPVIIATLLFSSVTALGLHLMKPRVRGQLD